MSNQKRGLPAAQARANVEAESAEMLPRESAARRAGAPRAHNYLVQYYRDEDVILDFSKAPEQAAHPAVEDGPGVLVVVVTFNCWAYTSLLLDALEKYRSYPYEVLVVDNGSTDGTHARLRNMAKRLPWLLVRGMGNNRGYAAAVNAGLDYSNGRDVVLLNNDVIPGATWCEGMIHAARKEPDTGVVGIKLRSLSGKLQHLGSVMSRRYVGDTNLWGVEVPDNGVYPGRWYPEVVMFSAAYITAAALAAVPKLDERFFAYLEDSDYCRQVWEAGLKVVYDGSVEMLHAHNTTARENGLPLGKIQKESREAYAAKWRDRDAVKYADGPVVLRGTYYGRTGYGQFTRELARALDLDGLPVWLNEGLVFDGARWRHQVTEENTREITRHLQHMEISDPSLAQIIVNVGLPSLWVRVPGRLNIGYTMLETDRIPPDWVDRCNAMDVVWVPAKAVADAFVHSGVRVPVRVLPGAVNTQVHHPAVRPLAMEPERFYVLSVFEWGERKAPEVLLEACGRLAHEWPDLELVLKTNSAEFDYATVVAEYARRYRLRVSVLTKAFPEYLMPSLYRACHVYASPSRGEGFGYPFVEAMACGIPVVGTDCTAQADYLTTDTGYPVPWEWAPAIARCPLYKGFRWAEPYLDNLVGQLRSSREEIGTPVGQARLEAARELVESRYSYEAVAARFRGLIGEACKIMNRPAPKWAL